MITISHLWGEYLSRIAWMCCGSTWKTLMKLKIVRFTMAGSIIKILNFKELDTLYSALYPPGNYDTFGMMMYTCGNVSSIHLSLCYYYRVEKLSRAAKYSFVEIKEVAIAREIFFHSQSLLMYIHGTDE